MNRPTRTLVVVGGGSAGWITANLIAAEHRRADEGIPKVILVESPDTPAIGVGEGTWPSMRMTLQRIGIAEDEYLSCCDASFKQGTRFFGWSGQMEADDYCHPFSFPEDYAGLNPARHWLARNSSAPFAEVATPQAQLMKRGFAPKQASTPPYAFAVNYGYHLDAAKFAAMLRDHAVGQLGVNHLSGHVERIEAHPDGDIAALALNTGERVAGDLFVDCTGFRALLIGGHCGQRLTSAADQLFNDAAVAVQVPYAEADAPIASATLASAEAAGWIWDIGLQSRRGLGHVFSRAHTDEASVRSALERYIARTFARRRPRFDGLPNHPLPTRLPSTALGGKLRRGGPVGRLRGAP